MKQMLTPRRSRDVLKFIAKRCGCYGFCFHQRRLVVMRTYDSFYWLWKDTSNTEICIYENGTNRSKPTYANALYDLIEACKNSDISDSKNLLILKKGTTIEQLLVEMELKNGVE